MLDRAFLGLTTLLVLAMLSASAAAISTPTVTFIPDKVSTNSAFIMIADPHKTQNESVIVTWGLNGPSPSEINRQGSFPRVGGRYVCYFSSTDNESTCGPSPFKNPSSVPPRSFSVGAVNQDNTTGIAVANISVGDIQMLPTVFTPDGKNISVRWYTNLVSTLSYKVYYASNYSEAGLAGMVPFSVDGYSIDIPTGPGDFFISLRIDASDGSGKFGGMLLHYKTPEGIYAGGGPVSLSVDTASFEVLLNKGQNYQRTGFSMTNMGSTPLSNLSVVIPSGYAPYLSVTLSNDTIAPGGTIFYTVVIGSSQHSMEMNAMVNVTSNEITIGQIPIRVNVSIVNECEGSTPANCPSSAGSGVSLSPPAWTGSYLAGEPATLNFTITNTGNTTISNLSYMSDFGSSLTAIIPTTLLPNGYAPASATLTSSYGGTRSGTITINTPQGSARIVVLVDFYSDISSSLSDIKMEYADFQSNLTSVQRNALAGAFSDLDSDISSAESAQENGNYESASEYYTKASAKLAALKNAFQSGNPITPAAQPVSIDTTTILIIVLVVAVAAFAFLIIRRRRSSGEEELEEELAEDFGPLPGESQ
jgi:hypothetical protein